MTTIKDVFDPRANTLNAIRLALASAVIIRHAQVLTSGSVETTAWNDQLIGQLPVDGFFAVSGYLIARSWLRKPDWRSFLLARFARIYPAFWVCLVITAFVLAPISVILGGGEWFSGFDEPNGPLGYVAKNLSLVMFQNEIAGTLGDVPWPGDWNGSLWTLKWEFACYVGVLAAGLVGVLPMRWAALCAFLAMWCACVFLVLAGMDHGVLDDFTRLGLMYASGVLLYRYSSSVLASGWLALACAVMVISSGFITDEYRLIAALPLAYTLIVTGALVQTPALRLPNDVSYGMYIYGFPVEQLLASSSVVDAGWGWFAVLAAMATAPLAMFSWWVVEKPVLMRVRGRRPAPVTKVAVLDNRRDTGGAG